MGAKFFDVRFCVLAPNNLLGFFGHCHTRLLLSGASSTKNNTGKANVHASTAQRTLLVRCLLHVESESFSNVFGSIRQ
jgi:hypothetical protein